MFVASVKALENALTMDLGDTRSTIADANRDVGTLNVDAYRDVGTLNTTPTSGTLSYRVRLLQANPGLLLRGGMLVNVTTLSAHHKHVLLVPSAALVTGTNGDSILTVVKGKAKNVPVRTGLTTDTRVEVAAKGLDAGATVITSPPSGVRDGSPVAKPGSGPPPGAPPSGGGK